MKKLLIALTAVAFLLSGTAFAGKKHGVRVHCKKMSIQARKCVSKIKAKKGTLKYRKRVRACTKRLRKCKRCVKRYRKCVKRIRAKRGTPRYKKARARCYKMYRKCRGRRPVLKRPPVIKRPQLTPKKKPIPDPGPKKEVAPKKEAS